MKRRTFNAMACSLLTLACLWGCLPQFREPMALEAGQPRSACWRKVRAEYLASVGGKCEACGTSEDVEAHHVEPFKKNPARECDPTNVVALCRRHHFELGHAFSFQHYNPCVREDAAHFRDMIANRKPNE